MPMPLNGAARPSFNVSSIEIHVVINTRRCLSHTFTDGSCNNVARCKIFLRVNALHDALSGCIQKNAAFTTHRFTN